MVADTLEKTDVEEDLSDIFPDDDDNTAHYFRKAHLDAMFFNGKSPIFALCGYRSDHMPLRAIDDRTPCGKCKDIYEQMRD